MTDLEKISTTALAAQGPHSPGLRVRARIPAPELRKYAVDLRVAALFSDDEAIAWQRASAYERARTVIAARRRLQRLLRDPGSLGDVAMVQRQVDMLPTLALERHVRRAGRLVLDIDDAIWQDTSPSAGGHALAWLKASSRKVRWLSAHADHVIAGNDVLANWLSPHAAQLTVIPSVVDPTQAVLRKHGASNRLVLGWIGSHSTAGYLQSLTCVLETLANTAHDLRFNLEAVGGVAPKVSGMDVRSYPWSERAERQLLMRMDIGLMPLPNDEWTRGKCAYKAIQYMAAGIPVICDDVGVSSSVVGNDAAGFVLSHRVDWVEALLHLSRDPLLRRRLGAEGRRRVERGFSVQRWAPTMAAVLRGSSG